MFQVSWCLEVSNVQECPWHLKYLPLNDLVCLGMFLRVLRVCFWWNLCGSSLNRIRTYSGWKRPGECPQGQTKGPWGRTLSLKPRLPKQPQMTEAVDGSWASQCPIDGYRGSLLRHGRIRIQGTDSIPNHEQP